MSAVQVIAVVPARRGSKRLAGKNRRLLDGRSLFDRALDCALESSSIGEVIATTDDPELLAGRSRERMLRTPTSRTTFRCSPRSIRFLRQHQHSPPLSDWCSSSVRQGWPWLWREPTRRERW